MKTRLLLAITLSLFCFSIFAQLSDTPVAAQAPDGALADWLRARINAQIHGNDDSLALRFPARNSSAAGSALAPLNGGRDQFIEQRITGPRITALTDLIEPLAGPL